MDARRRYATAVVQLRSWNTDLVGDGGVDAFHERVNQALAHAMQVVDAKVHARQGVAREGCLQRVAQWNAKLSSNNNTRGSLYGEATACQRCMCVWLAGGLNSVLYLSGRGDMEGAAAVSKDAL